MAASPHLRSDAQANRARLLEAARAVFAERGLAAEMKEIAERAGVGMGTIYRNFVNKEELVEALVREVIEATMGLLAGTRGIDDPLARLRAILGVAWSCAEADGPLIVALGGAAGSEPPAEILGELQRVLRDGQERGHFRSTVEVLPFCLFVAGQLETYLNMRRQLSTEAAAGAMTDLVVHAVLSPGATLSSEA
ncbi:MAG: TetR/AcrR family transcriptional regulator [Dehalococcoidia bacterium]